MAGLLETAPAKKLNSFLFTPCIMGNMTPLQWVEHLVKLEKTGISKTPLRNCMMTHKLGQYNRLEGAFKGILQFKNQLRSVSVAQLESVSGIGSKTSRFFVLHSRPNQQVAVLDTHILKYMKEQGYVVPKTTPTKSKYLAIEQQFIFLAQESNMSVADFDLQIWKKFSKNNS